MFLYFLLALALTAADQAVKAWTVGHFAAPAAGFTATADAYAPCIPGILELTRVHNYGAAWSSFSGMRWLLSAVTAAILIAVLVLLLRGADPGGGPWEPHRPGAAWVRGGHVPLRLLAQLSGL